MSGPNPSKSRGQATLQAATLAGPDQRKKWRIGPNQQAITRGTTSKVSGLKGKNAAFSPPCYGLVRAVNPVADQKAQVLSFCISVQWK